MDGNSILEHAAAKRGALDQIPDTPPRHIGRFERGNLVCREFSETAATASFRCSGLDAPTIGYVTPFFCSTMPARPERGGYLWPQQRHLPDR